MIALFPHLLVVKKKKKRSVNNEPKHLKVLTDPREDQRRPRSPDCPDLNPIQHSWGHLPRQRKPGSVWHHRKLCGTLSHRAGMQSLKQKEGILNTNKIFLKFTGIFHDSLSERLKHQPSVFASQNPWSLQNPAKGSAQPPLHLWRRVTSSGLFTDARFVLSLSLPSPGACTPFCTFVPR